ncbi:hypothetical protein D3C71_1847960 [compost metagenome]
MKPFAQRITRGIQQRADALLLIVVQHHPAHAVRTQLVAQQHQGKNAGPANEYRGQNQLPRQPREKDHGQACC